MAAKTGINKARETAKEIGTKVTSEKRAGKEAAESALAKLQKNPNLVQMYRDNADLGSEHLSGSLPLLKIHKVEKSKNELADGKEPNDGWFFYSQDKSQYKEINCHILSISRGFRAPGMDDRKDEKIFNQLVGGVITNDGALKPFLMYITGLKLAPMWEFGKEASKFTKRSDLPIPLFALSVKLTTSPAEHRWGKSWIVNFEIVQNEDDTPVIVTDEGLFVFLRDHVSTIQGTMERIITAKSGESTYEGAPHPAEDAEIEAD